MMCQVFGQEDSHCELTDVELNCEGSDTPSQVLMLKTFNVQKNVECNECKSGNMDFEIFKLLVSSTPIVEAHFDPFVPVSRMYEMFLQAYGKKQWH